MNKTVKWIWAGLLLAGATAWAQAPSPPDATATPDWLVSSSPARFVVEEDANPSAKPAPISAVSLSVPDPNWLNLPIRVFADNGTPVGSDLLWTAPGEPATLVFDSSSGSKHYNIYLGSNWPAMHLVDSRAGVILESRAFPPRSFTILSATYGYGSVQRDVRELLNPMIREGRLNFIPTNQNMGGDPLPGPAKILHLKYSFNGQVYDQSFIQDAPVLLPEQAQLHNLNEMLQAWNQSTTIYGRALIGGIFEGGHRFGPEENLIEHFQGWFNVAAPEHLQVAACTQDPSFVLVDGKAVISRPGAQSLDGGRRIQLEGAVDLMPGPHLLECYYVYVPDFMPCLWRPHPLQCTIGFKTGGAEQWTALVPGNTFFKPYGYAHVIDYQLQANEAGTSTGGAAPPFAIDCESTPGVYCQSVISPFISDVGLISVQLTCRSSLSGQATWTFDDGTTAEGATVQHIFPRPGLRTVKLSMKNATNDLGTVVQTIRVHPDWLMMNTVAPQLFPVHATEIMSRDPTTFSASDLAGCMAVFGTYGSTDGVLKLLPAACAKMKDISDADLPYILTAGVYLAGEDRLHFTEAGQLLQALVDRCAAAKPLPPVDKIASEAKLALAQVMLTNSNDTAAVKALLDGINDQVLDDKEHRELLILPADLTLATGDVAGAKKQYLAVGSSDVDARSSIRLTAIMDHAVAYIGQKDYESAEDALAQVIFLSPVKTLSPDWALLRLRLYQEEGLTGPAYVWAVRLLPVITESGRSELLFRLTDLAFAQGRDDVAKKALAELLQKYPYGEEAAQAKEKWPGKG